MEIEPPSKMLLMRGPKVAKLDLNVVFVNLAYANEPIQVNVTSTVLFHEPSRYVGRFKVHF